MTENMKIWFQRLLLTEAADHIETANFEHLCSLGSPDDEAAMLHEMNSDEHREYANILRAMAKEIDNVEVSYD